MAGLILTLWCHHGYHTLWELAMVEQLGTPTVMEKLVLSIKTGQWPPKRETKEGHKECLYDMHLPELPVIYQHKERKNKELQVTMHVV